MRLKKLDFQGLVFINMKDDREQVEDENVYNKSKKVQKMGEFQRFFL